MKEGTDMQLDVVRNAKRNMIFGLANKIVSLLLPFFVRTAIIKTIGADYLGLDSLFTSILQVLNLSELGFGTAIVYSMYKPIAEDDTDTICGLMLLYRKIYRIIGCIILCLGICLIPFLTHFIKGDYPSELNLYVLYCIYLMNTVLSYMLFAYKTSLLNAFQREDVVSNIRTLTKAILYVLQIIIVFVFKNYYAYLIILPLTTVLNNLIVAYDVDKRYPQYKCRGTVSKTIKSQLKTKVAGLMVSRVCQVSRVAFDSIFISAFSGLTIAAMYDNYYYVNNAITVLMSIILTSLLAGVGNKVANFSETKNHEDLCRLDYLYMLLGGWCAICLLCLYQPFMYIWVGKNYMFPFGVVILCVLYFYVLKMGDIRAIYVNATGLWWENRLRSIMEAVANIILNYLMGKLFGVYGIIGATIISLIIFNFIYGSRLIYKHYFKEESHSKYVLSHLLYFLVTAIIATITYAICSIIHISNMWIVFAVRLLICTTVPVIMYFLIYRKTAIYKKSVPWVLEKLHLDKKLKFLL